MHIKNQQPKNSISGSLGLQTIYEKFGTYVYVAHVM